MFISRLLFCVLFGMSMPQSGLGADTNVSDIIEKAKELSLMRERSLAAELLNEAISKEPEESEKREELVKVLGQVSKVFYTQNGQKEYELAESLFYSQKTGAANHYEQALKLEPNNTIVLLGLMRESLGRGDCKKTKEYYERIEAIDPYDMEAKYLGWVATDCLGEILGPGFKESKSLFSNEKIKPYANILLAKVKIEASLIEEALSLLGESKKSLPGFPEPNYFLHLIKTEEAADSFALAREYVSMCRKITSIERRKFNLEPRLCRFQSELEAEISKRESENE